MTIRTPNDKTAVSLVKTAFKAAGATCTHTQALDLVAKLQGYQSWAHKQSVAREPKTPAPRTAQQIAESLVTMTDTGVKSRIDFWKDEVAKGDSTLAFGPWLVDRLEHEYDVDFPRGTYTEASARVTLPDGRATNWAIEQNLSDRWGDLNCVQLDQKPSMMRLMTDAPLVERLQKVMTGEDSFVVVKDGRFGVLVEIEYCSRESDTHSDTQEEVYPPYEAQKALLLDSLKGFAKDYPQLEFSVPDASCVYNGRPAVWGFIALDVAEAMTSDDRESLAVELSSI